MRSPEIGTFNSRPELGEALDEKTYMTRAEIAAYLRELYAKDPNGFDLDAACTDLKQRLDEAVHNDIDDITYQFLIYFVGNCSFEEIK